MKKILFYATAMMVAMTMVFTSCGPTNQTPLDPGTPEVNPDKPSVPEQLSPEETKEKLMGVARRMTDMFKTDDQKAFIELADDLYEKYESYSWEGIADYYENRLNAVFGMPRYLKQVIQGRRAPSAVDHMYVFSFEGESAIFEADDVTKTWKQVGKPDDNSVILRFKDKNGVQCEAKAWGVGQTQEHGYSWDENGETYTINVLVPEKEFFTLTHGNTEQARVEVRQDLQQNDHYNLYLDAKLTNIRWTTDLKATHTSASAVVEFYYGDERMISLAANLPSYKLIDKEDSQSYEEWVELYADRYDELLKKIGDANGIIDLMGEVQILMKIGNCGYAYRDFSNWIERETDTKESYDKLCDLINANQANSIFFNSDVVQAQVRAQTAMDNYGHYYPEGVLYFPADGTTYAFEEYFNRKPFTDLQYTVEDLVNQYIELSRYLYDAVGEVRF